MREVVPPPSVREFIGHTCRVVIERVWQQRPSGNGHPAFDPVVVVHVHLVGAGPEGIILLTPERFDAVAHDFAAVAGRVLEASREMLRDPGDPPTPKEAA